jgi:hypothetical protein
MDNFYAPPGDRRDPRNNTWAAIGLKRSLRNSKNRHWLSRLIIATWSLSLPLNTYFGPPGPLLFGVEWSGPMGDVMMALVAGLATLALADSALNDWYPGDLGNTLMNYRHLGFMGLAVVLVVAGGGIAVSSQTPVVLASFLLPALFCVVVTFLDLHVRHQRRKFP